MRGRNTGRAPRTARRDRGQALVEFALMIPIFAMLLFGLVDFGRVVYAQNTVTQAAREASRVAIVSASQSAGKYAQIRTAAMQMAPGLGLTSADITGSGCADCFYPTTAASGSRVVVKVTKAISLLTPIVAQVVGGSITVSSTSQSFIP